MIYKVICTTTSVAEILVQARSKKEAIKIATEKGLIAEAKDEIVGNDYDAEKVGAHPKGRIVNTKSGYIDADKKRHKF